MPEKISVPAVLLAFIPVVGVVAGVILLRQKPRNGKIMIAVGVTSFVLLQALHALLSAGGAGGISGETSADTASASWVRVRDPESGTSFLLPKAVKPQERTKTSADGRTEHTRTYQSGSPDLGVSVAVVQAKGGFSGYDGNSVYRTITQRLSGGGAEDVHLTSTRRSRVHDMDCFDGTITFTSTQGDQTYWRLRALAGPKALLLIQAQVFAPRTDDKTRARVDQAFLHVTGSLTTS